MDNEGEVERLPSVDEAVDRWNKATDRIKCDEDGTLQNEEAAIEDVVEIVISGSILVDLLRSTSPTSGAAAMRAAEAAGLGELWYCERDANRGTIPAVGEDETLLTEKDESFLRFASECTSQYDEHFRMRAKQTLALNTRLRALLADVARLTEWKAGAIGALTILHPPRTHGHTESAYLSHKARYEAGMVIPGDPYCDAADFVAVQVEADRAAAIRALPTPKVLTEYVQAIEAAATVDDRVDKVLAAHSRATKARLAYKEAVR